MNFTNRSTLRRRGPLLVLAVALTTLLAPACGSSNNNNSNKMPCLEFSGAETAAPGRVVAQRDASSTCDIAVIDFFATDVQNLYGAQIQLVYDPSEVSFTGASVTGSILESDGTPIQLVTGGPVGTVDVGVSRLQAPAGIDVVGTQFLVRVTFFRISGDNGSSSLDIGNAALIGPETPPVTKPGISFSGGTFRIDRI